MRNAWLGPLLICLFVGSSTATAAPAEVEAYLHRGELKAAETAMVKRLAANPADSEAAFSLGIVQFLRSIERLGQGLHRFTPGNPVRPLIDIPFLRLPVPENSKPETASLQDIRRILLDMQSELTKAEASFGRVTDDKVTLSIRILDIQLDLTGDGKPESNLRNIIARYLSGGRAIPAEERLEVKFDRGDVDWFRGYCHLLLGISEVMLAHDAQEFFETSGLLFFADVKTPHEFLRKLNENDRLYNIGNADLIDILVALQQIARLPMQSPERMKRALEHFERTFELSRASWKFIVAETDNDHEWLPNAVQTGPFGATMTDEQIQSWQLFTQEMSDILAGKRLIPFWRGTSEKRGLNLRRVFLEPRDFQILRWIQGTAATPYLENGPMTRPEVWRRLQDVFGGQFFGFALWVN
ncbi:hypothetical protein [Tuwongella immobilis]|uniref:Uncharacterized protein n=1 Tax=Tuwongella immobilis TaxID=692036 RepID=A0A6C2YJ93_9BACT|nr:hypothetical protein [Tuwongella immobilis]VIP01042.1 Uncharacterized protein OS=Singulisphaera acidiphila (strain ATCC BAA-1392 / DSM 18658 / VKM B-2454 / MOB10) GN=Sinac_7017 PE=4 SV=1 [Tuwongella immobilis]VTR97509.1 Uncharacterized protein OS=Singulisphaera acidiphila (strain ATCC BAA-1392 / DSM 18658 / VKM B-2454 / MOB10) GN=Sinac_7017 PE=4 SV=1 [Tuwongella immobilis]